MVTITELQRARHQHVLLSSAYPPHSAAREPLAQPARRRARPATGELSHLRRSRRLGSRPSVLRRGVHTGRGVIQNPLPVPVSLWRAGRALAGARKRRHCQSRAECRRQSRRDHRDFSARQPPHAGAGHQRVRRRLPGPVGGLGRAPSRAILRRAAKLRGAKICFSFREEFFDVKHVRSG